MKLTKQQLVRVYRAIRNLGDTYPDEWYSEFALGEWIDAHGVDATVERLRQLYGVHRIVVTGESNARTILYAPRGRDLRFYLAFDHDGTIRVRYHDAYIVARERKLNANGFRITPPSHSKYFSRRRASSTSCASRQTPSACSTSPMC
jgi:hypothetical protein